MFRHLDVLLFLEYMRGPSIREMIEGNFNGPNSCKTSMDLDLVTCLDHVQRNKCLTFGLDGLV